MRVLESHGGHTFRVVKWASLTMSHHFLENIELQSCNAKCIPHQDILFEAKFFTEIHSNCSVHKQAMT